MAGSASYKFSIPYDGELKKGLTVIGLEYSYGYYPSVAIYDGNKWVCSNGNIGISSIELKNSILSLTVLMVAYSPYYISAFQTENFPTE